MAEAFICDYIRTPIGRFGGGLSSVRTDDLGAIPIQALIERNKGLDPVAIDDVFYGCANQAGEDNRNVARMALLLAGLPESVPGGTINRLCGSGMDALITAARAIKAGEAELMIAGGVESMSRAPFVMPKADAAFSRKAEIYDTTIGWRFVNPAMKKQYGVDSMPETAENVAEEFGISREDQDAFGLQSNQRALAAIESGRFKDEIIPIETTLDGKEIVFDTDDGPRASTLEGLAKLRTPFKVDGKSTAGNSSQTSDGAALELIMSRAKAEELGLTPMAELVTHQVGACHPDEMGIGPSIAIPMVLEKAGLTVDDIGLFELNEAFASQALYCVRELGLDMDIVNVNGGAVALGHPLGCTGAKLTATLLHEMQKRDVEYGIVSMCIGGGMGAAGILENLV
ncbi:MAG: acetyl-CoA C-acyltransferase [Alphaproteobacteria bacterium]|nr:acetyl-CoA C-acyltransferase [Alphaproteobacteria bacterium]